jgi:hypothetical protein
MKERVMMHLVSQDGLTYVGTLRMIESWATSCKRFVEVMPDGRSRVFDLHNVTLGVRTYQYVGTAR